MKFILASVLAALPLLASSHVIQSRSQRRVCGNEDVEVPRSLKDLHDRLAANESARRPSASFSASIPTYFHIVSTTANQNMVTDQMVADQLSVLNTHYAGTGFTFDLVATDRVVNAQWAAQNNEAAMQKALRKGKYSSLNIYFLTDLPQPLLGQCNYPQANPGYVTSSPFYGLWCYSTTGISRRAFVRIHKFSKTNTEESGDEPVDVARISQWLVLVEEVLLTQLAPSHPTAAKSSLPPCPAAQWTNTT